MSSNEGRLLLTASLQEIESGSEIPDPVPLEKTCPSTIVKNARFCYLVAGPIYFDRKESAEFSFSASHTDRPGLPSASSRLQVSARYVHRGRR